MSTSRRTRFSRGLLSCALVSAVVAVPFILVRTEFSLLGQGSDESLHMLTHLAALLAISFIFLQIVTGAFRPVLRRWFDSRRLQSMHVTFGSTGFGFALAHFGLLVPSLSEHWDAVNHGFFVLGPITAGVLIITISTAILMRKLPGIWNKLHILNYAVFIVGVIHGLAIGTQGTMLATRIILVSYAALALAGLIYRVRMPEWRRRMAPAALRTRKG